MPAAVSPAADFNILTVDISPHVKDPTSTEALKLIEQVHIVCITTGFFPLDDYGTLRKLQDDVFKGSAGSFSLPFEEKKKLDKSHSVGSGNRDYEVIGNQALQEGTLPDMKEASMLAKKSHSKILVFRHTPFSWVQICGHFPQ